MFDNSQKRLQLVSSLDVYNLLDTILKRKTHNLSEHKTFTDGQCQGEFGGRRQPTASPMLTAIMSGGVGISGRELYKYR